MPHMPAPPSGRTAFGWLVGAALALITVAATAAFVGPAPAAVDAALLCGLVIRPALVLQRERRLRHTAARGISEIESLLTIIDQRNPVSVGGVAELCPACGRPVHPRTGRCDGEHRGSRPC